MRFIIRNSTMGDETFYEYFRKCWNSFMEFKKAVDNKLILLVYKIIFVLI